MVFILAVLTLVTGCGGTTLKPSVASPATAQPDLSGVLGDRSISVQADVGLRTVLVHHPDSVGARAPLVVVLHGEGSSAEQARTELGWNAVADREGFVVAYPEGANHTWNAGPTCCFPNNSGVNDVGFLNEALSALTKQDLIDRSRVFAVGFSAGGSMAYAWECAHPGLLAGVGPVEAKLLIKCPVVAPVTVAAVYGRSDRAVPPVDLTAAAAAQPPVPTPAPSSPVWERDQPSNAPAPAPGAAPTRTPAPGGVPGRSEDQTLVLFRGVDGCPDQPAAVIAGPPAMERSWNCVATHSVSATVVQGVGHQWPGASRSASGGTEADPDPASPHGGAPPSPGVDLAPATTFDTDEWLWSHLRNARSR